MGGGCMPHRVVPETLDTPKGIWGKIHREKKPKKQSTDTFQGLTGIKGQSSGEFTGSLGVTTL